MQPDLLGQNLNNMLPFSALLSNFPNATNQVNVPEAAPLVARDEDVQNPALMDPQEERRGRKNERERRRRAEVNECFDILASILKVNRKNKADKTSVLQTAISAIQAYEAQLMQLTSSGAQGSSQAAKDAMELDNLRKELAATKAQLDSKEAALKRANNEISQLRAQLNEATAVQAPASTSSTTNGVPVLPAVPKPETQSLAAALECITQMTQNKPVLDLPQTYPPPLPPIKEESGRKSPSPSSHRLDDPEDVAVPPTKRLHRVSPKASFHRYSQNSTNSQAYASSPSIGSLTDHFKDVDINANNNTKSTAASTLPSKSGLVFEFGNLDPVQTHADSMIIKDLDEASIATGSVPPNSNSNPFNLSFDVGLPIDEVVSDPELLPQKCPSFSNLQIPEFFTF